MTQGRDIGDFLAAMPAASALPLHRAIAAGAANEPLISRRLADTLSCVAIGLAA
jgi:hypothetical protein